jgi:hypothetical protein
MIALFLFPKKLGKVANHFSQSFGFLPTEEIYFFFLAAGLALAFGAALAFGLAFAFGAAFAFGFVGIFIHPFRSAVAGIM